MKDPEISSLKPGIYGVAENLQLIVSNKGGRSFRVRVRIGDKYLTKVVGAWPGTTVKAAKIRASDLAYELRQGIDRRSETRRSMIAAEKSQNDSFGTWANNWVRANTSWSLGYLEDCQSRINRYLKPTKIWNQAIGDVNPVDLAMLLDDINAKKPDTASKVKIILGGIFRYARGKGRKDIQNPTQDIVIGSGKKTAKKHRPALTDLVNVQKVIRDTELCQCAPATKTALFLYAHTLQRASNICAARWSQFDLENATWRIPREDMKVKHGRPDHTLPLSKQVVTRLKAWRSLLGDTEYLFPNAGGNGHLTIEAPSKLYKRSLGLDGIHVPHGWRASFKTIMNKQTKADGTRQFDRIDIHDCTDHEERSKTDLSYERDRAEARMRVIMQQWSDLLENANEG